MILVQSSPAVPEVYIVEFHAKLVIIFLIADAMQTKRAGVALSTSSGSASITLLSMLTLLSLTLSLSGYYHRLLQSHL